MPFKSAYLMALLAFYFDKSRTPFSSDAENLLTPSSSQPTKMLPHSLIT